MKEIEIPKLSVDQSQKWKGVWQKYLTIDHLEMMKSQKNFTKHFWNELKIPLLPSINKTFKVGELSTSQKQVIIKLIGKKDKDKRFIKNWR